MKNRSIEGFTTEELTAKNKTLGAILMVLAILILLYGVYFIIKLVSGTWQANNTLGIVGLGVMSVASSVISIQKSKIEQEIKRRRDSH